ncbi:hypothetical protein [Cyclobacterium xiamenense]|uniref:hypothetical protein n=1 Tax=Cyclobacterium xiamenense TaxID=1297121 RepID=UPI0035D03454
MSKNLNYNTDVVKHYVRYYGWIKPFKSILNFVDAEIKKGRRDNNCKYLTFCAAQAIDVFLFEYLKYLYRNEKTNRLENVYFCENDEESFSIIQKMIGSSEQGFFGDFKQIILQDETEQIGNIDDPFDEPETEDEREKLRLIELKKGLLAKFPFDVINLDIYGNFFPNSEKRYSDAFQTYKGVLEQQKRGNTCKRFLMYLTVYTPVLNKPRYVNPDVITSFEMVLLGNLVYPEFEQAFLNKYGHTDPRNIEVYQKFILGFTKQILFKETYKLGWKPKLHNMMAYDRIHHDNNAKYKITTFVVEYRRDSALDGFDDFDGNVYEEIEEDYKAQLFNIVTNKPEYVPSEDQIPKEVSENLLSTVAFRNAFLKKIGLYKSEIFD